MAGYCEQCYETSGSIKVGKFLRNDFPPWRLRIFYTSSKLLIYAILFKYIVKVNMYNTIFCQHGFFLCRFVLFSDQLSVPSLNITIMDLCNGGMFTCQ
jgi:hypothetical protein